MPHQVLYWESKFATICCRSLGGRSKALRPSLFFPLQDLASVCSNGSRISGCMAKYFAHFKRFDETVAVSLLSAKLRPENEALHCLQNRYS